MIFRLFALLILLFSTSVYAGGAGGSWGCPDGWTTKPDGFCSFDGGGGSGSGSGSGGSWSPEICVYQGQGKVFKTTTEAGVYGCADNDNGSFVSFGSFPPGNGTHASALCTGLPPSYQHTTGGSFQKVCTENPDPEPDLPPLPPLPPDFPDVPPPTPDCNVCQSLYEIKLKLNVLKNQDIKIINQSILDMSQVINNIDNSIGDLNVNNTQINTNIENINTSITNLVTNIENNNITQNEIKNEVNNIKNVMNDYSLQLGDIKLAMGDIDLSLKNTNKLVLDLGLDLDFIKNKLVNDSSKDYTPYLNEIISLLNCEPNKDGTKTCNSGGYDDTKMIKLLTDLNDFVMQPLDEQTDSGLVDIIDLADRVDSNKVKIDFSNQCPAPTPINTSVGGFPISTELNYQPLCDFFTMLNPFVIGMGGISSALIIAGGVRRG